MNKERKEELQKLFVEALREQKEIQEKADGLGVAMIIREDKPIWIFNEIDVYLINDSDVDFHSVKILTGAFCSDDVGLMETGKAVTGPFNLPKHTALRIGASDTGELDYVVWFYVEMIDEIDGVHKYKFNLSKYDRKTIKLPILNIDGIPLEFKKHGESIDAHVKNHDMKPRYIKYDEE